MRMSLFIAFLVTCLDQATKTVMLENIFRLEGMKETPFFSPVIVEVLPFLQFRLVWNYGISFSLFNSGTSTMIIILICLQTVIAGVLVWWVRNAQTMWLKIGGGLIIGGAIGNIIDRVIYKAVIDFVDFHIAGYHFPTFNLADTCITIGVCLWLVDIFISKDCNEDPANVR
jgi:signal peptidase II